MKPILIILFNHKFERNLPRLREIYASKFDNVYFVIPFYQGDDKDVITVYENSFYFQGYIAQALDKLKNEIFSHYIVIGDDLLLNPHINQDNYSDFFGVGIDDGFIPEVFLLHDEETPRRLMRKEPHWFWNSNAVKFKTEQKGIEVVNELPSVDNAKRLLHVQGYEFEPILTKDMLYQRYPKWGSENVNDIKTYATHIFNCAVANFKLNSKKRRTISYPMVASYSDIVVIPHKSIKQFAHYAGVMAALNLFVEIAIPTALLFAVENIVQEKHLTRKGITLWEPDEVNNLGDKYKNSLRYLYANFPQETLYIHPIKLSKWK